MINNYDTVDIFNLLFSINHIFNGENTFFTVLDNLVSGENSVEWVSFMLKFVNISGLDI